MTPFNLLVHVAFLQSSAIFNECYNAKQKIMLSCNLSEMIGYCEVSASAIATLLSLQLQTLL